MSPAKISDLLLTLIKTLLVLICIAVGIALFIPFTMSSTHESANQTRLLANGIGIYKAIWPGYPDGLWALPKTTEKENSTFRNSTDYFVHLVTNDLLSVTWSYFSAQGVPAAAGTYRKDDPETLREFKAENNAWCVVGDLKTDQTGTPFLITRNLQATRLNPDYGAEDAPIVHGPPYDDKALVVIRMGGAGEVMRNQNILWKNINPTPADNRILRP